jgi:uncharacterized protein YwqG
MRPEEVRRNLTLTRFAHFTELIEALAERCIEFEVRPTDEDSLPVGCSKLGGSPDLPREMDWPTFEGRPLSFLLQLNLGELLIYPNREHLPESGLLYFFHDSVTQRRGYSPEDRASWRVIYQSVPVGELGRRAHPAETEAPSIFTACRMWFHETLSPGWDDIPTRLWRVDKHDIGTYCSDILDFPPENGYQILGHPTAIESDEVEMQRTCQYVSNGLHLGGGGGEVFDEDRAEELEPLLDQWTLLLQLDSDERTGMRWGNNGRLYFWIRREDLQRCDFSNVWMILDSE